MQMDSHRRTRLAGRISKDCNFRLPGFTSHNYPGTPTTCRMQKTNLKKPTIKSNLQLPKSHWSTLASSSWWARGEEEEEEKEMDRTERQGKKRKGGKVNGQNWKARKGEEEKEREERKGNGQNSKGREEWNGQNWKARGEIKGREARKKVKN